MNPIVKTLLTVVGVPTLVASLYFGLLASDVYVSETKFAVRSATSSVSLSGLGAFLSSTGASGAGQDSMLVMDYTRSLDMLDRLRESVDLIGHYAADEVDLLSRLDHEASRDELLRYFRGRIEVQRDLMSDVVTLKVRAFEPVMAQRVADLLIDINEEFVNDVSRRIEEDAVASAREELVIAADKIRKTASVINRFQNANDSISPQDESAALFTRLAALEARISETRAELSERLAFMREDSADVVSLKNRINALERQLQLEKGRVLGDEDGALGGLLEKYAPLALEQEIAQQQYTSALAGFEAARIDAQRQKQYLVRIVEPSLPDASAEPRRLVKILTVMMFSFMAYLIGGLLWSALKDHIGH